MSIRIRKQYFISILVSSILLLLTTSPVFSQPIKIGSKVFTESVVLGELATQLGKAAGTETVHLSQLGGTRILWDSLIAGRIDVYPEYTGTIIQELLPSTSENAIRDALAVHGIGMTRPLGFNDTYAIGMLRTNASNKGIARLSDLKVDQELRFGFSNEFMERADGWPLVRSRYALPQQQVTGLDHDLAYRAVAAGKVDAIDLYSTDAEIAFYHLQVLKDDLHVFPRYDAVFLYRLDLDKRAPAFLAAIEKLEGQINEASMIGMNAESKLQKQPEAVVARKFLSAKLGVASQATQATLFQVFLARTSEHLFLVLTSLALSITIAIPLAARGETS